MVSLEDAKVYIHIDYDDDNDDIKNMIETAQIFIDSMVGEKYKEDEKAVKMADLLVKKIVYQMYENRSVLIPNNLKEDKIVNSMLDKLALYGWSE